MAQKHNNGGGEVLHTFTLGNKEFEGKTAEFLYDKGNYSIIDIIGEERSVIYKSRNAQEAYTKWNVYIGRKKERPERPKNEDRESNRENADTRNDKKKNDSPKNSSAAKENREDNKQNHRGDRKKKENTSNEHTEAASTGGYNQGFTATEGSEEKKPRPHRNRNRNRNRGNKESQGH